jgi:hypothetical protein
MRGVLPDDIGTWFAITSFDVSGNALTGPIPASVSGWRSLEEFKVAGNQFSGAFPKLQFVPRFLGCSVIHTSTSNDDGYMYPDRDDDAARTNTFDCPWPDVATKRCGVSMNECAGTHSCDQDTGKCVYDPSGNVTKAQCKVACNTRMPTPWPTPVPPTNTPTPAPTPYATDAPTPPTPPPTIVNNPPMVSLGLGVAIGLPVAAAVLAHSLRKRHAVDETSAKVKGQVQSSFLQAPDGDLDAHYSAM